MADLTLSPFIYSPLKKKFIYKNIREMKLGAYLGRNVYDLQFPNSHLDAINK